MSIAPLKKVTLIGVIASKHTVLDALQYLGILHLVPLTNQKYAESSNHHARLKEALRYLNSAPHKRRPQLPRSDYKVSSVVKEVLENKRQRSKVADRIDLIKHRILDLKPWGDFNYPDLDQLDGHRLWFYCVPLSRRHEMDAVDLPWKILGEDHRHYHAVVIARDEPDNADVPFERVHVGSRSLSQLHEDLNEALVELEDLDAQRQSLTRWITPLTRFLDESVDLERMAIAKGFSFDTDDCFVLRGWVAETTLAELDALSQRLHFAYMLSDPEPGEMPPTLLQNSELMGGGQEAVSFFQLPGYRSWDPSSMIFVSFSLFFAIILADAGYALILAVFLGLYWKKLSINSKRRRLRNLAVSMVTLSTVYGALIGSYFGIEIEPDSFLGHFQLLDINDFSAMMQLSIGIGALHLIAANGIAGWYQRQSTVMYSRLGWVLVISSAFIIWLNYMHDNSVPTLTSASVLIIFLGLILVLLFTGERPIHTARDVALRARDGFIALYGISKAFGDILSYMRLFALGLSSASLAVTFNHLAIEASESFDTGGFLVFLFIVFFGHLLNFILALMGGVIHGLRLNLLEFYNWGIEGEGQAFDAFRRNQVPEDIADAALDYESGQKD